MEEIRRKQEQEEKKRQEDEEESKLKEELRRERCRSVAISAISGSAFDPDCPDIKVDVGREIKGESVQEQIIKSQNESQVN